MIEDEIKVRLTQRFLAAQTPWGRWRLNTYVRWKGFSWRLVVSAASFVKREIDITVSLVVLILFLPVFALLALLVKLDGGPVFSRQARIGLRGREFKMIKYRTAGVDADASLRDMVAQSEKGASVTVRMKGDPFLTKTGRILHGASLDELPQFLNVLKGEMSLVGPRAPVPREVGHYSQADLRRLSVKPGMTCLWQVGSRGGGLQGVSNRGAMRFSEEVALDVRYIESQSVWLDLLILMKTVPAVLFGRGM
ncbi:MAG: hypothetical protein A2107_15245 [Verrucomicrobia bacterium GWF2_62_7]|nr:MAG: hypothetical protein A2107_15245 [Verrucomicrobia bacterium GWF2_62_7]